MSVLAGHALFAGVSSAALDALSQRVAPRHCQPGEVILRAGEASRGLHGLVRGVVRVELDGRHRPRGRAVTLAPPQTFGEMSVISGSAVSATVVALGEGELWSLAAPDVLELLADEPAFFRNLALQLSERLRHRTRADARAGSPRLVVLPLASEVPPWFQAVASGLRHYEPGSAAPGCDRSADVAARIAAWRNEGAGDAVLLLALPVQQFSGVQPLLAAGDSVLCWQFNADAGAATPVLVRGEDEARADDRWAHVLPIGEVAAAATTGAAWSRAAWSALDRLVRRLCGREVGIALSVGAAPALAHLGLLQLLDEAGVPLDYLCGSSMGAAVALSYAQQGSARAATEAVVALAMALRAPRASNGCHAAG